MIEIKYRAVKKLAILYVIIPTIIFFAGWLNIIFAVIGIIGMITAVIIIFKNESKNIDIENKSIIISSKSLVLSLFIAMLWCFFAGQGGFFYQSEDHNIRNAIFRDLINYDWPVRYTQTNNALVYYIGHWLVPAIIGKISKFFIGEQLAWLVGNIALYLWSTIGIFIVFLLLYFVIEVKSKKAMYISLLIFILFSGLDFFGIILQCITNRRLILVNHIESWSGFWEYSSITTCLFWVYNQAIVCWIIILLFLKEKKLSLYAFLGIISIPYSPIPFIGMLPYFVIRGIKRCIDNKNEKISMLKEIFSIPNLIASIIVFPIFYFYYSSNAVINDKGFGLSNGYAERGLVKSVIIFILFIILEYGIYAILIWKNNKRNIDYYITITVLFILPLFRLGSASDFTMRASIPALTILMVLVIQYLLNMKTESKTIKSRLLLKVLIITLLFGSITPLYEFARAGYSVIFNGNKIADNVKTLSDEVTDEVSNFVTYNPDDKFFYKYLAK